VVRALGLVSAFPLARLYGNAENMAKSITVMPKKRGRPATGRDPQIIVRLAPSMIEAIDARAAKDSITRSEQVRRLLEQALAKGAKR
jgi:hypothetical protein